MRRHTSQRPNTTSNWLSSSSRRPRSQSVGELVRCRSEGWHSEVIHPNFQHNFEEKTDYPDPPYEFGDFHHIERAALSVHNEERYLVEYLKQVVSHERVDYIKEKYLLLASKAISDSKVIATALKIEEKDMIVAFFMAIRVQERRAEKDKAVLKTVLIDRGHTGRAMAVKTLMDQKLLHREPQSPRGTEVFSNNNNLARYRIPEKIVQKSPNPRFHRAIPDVSKDKLYLVPIVPTSGIKPISPVISLQKTGLDLKKTISRMTGLDMDDIKPQIGPGLYVINQSCSLYEQGIQKGTVLFY